MSRPPSILPATAHTLGLIVVQKRRKVGLTLPNRCRIGAAALTFRVECAVHVATETSGRQPPEIEVVAAVAVEVLVEVAVAVFGVWCCWLIYGTWELES